MIENMFSAFVLALIDAFDWFVVLIWTRYVPADRPLAVEPLPEPTSHHLSW